MNKNIEDSGLSIGKVFGALRRRKPTLMITGSVGLLVTLLLAALIPPSYKSASTILIEQQEIPTNLVQSTVTSFAAQRLEVITQRVMTQTNLWQIVEKYDLYSEDRRTETRKEVIDQMREDVGRQVINAEVIDPVTKRTSEAIIAFKLSYQSPSPALAQKVANELTTLYLSENLKNRSESAEEASRFLSDETSRLDTELKRIADQLAQFKEQNFDALPELRDINLRQLDRAESELRENRLALERVNERIIFLEAELAQTDPDAPFVLDQSGTGLSSAARLKLLKNQYDANRASYTESHPSVIRLKSEIESLMPEVSDEAAPQVKLDVIERQLRDAKTKYSDKHPTVIKLSQRAEMLEKLVASGSSNSEVDGSADNPVYVNLKSQLDAIYLEKKSIEKRQIQLNKEIAGFETIQKQAPGVEQEYLELSRQYEALLNEYAQAKRRQELAELGQSLETEQKGERFTLIEPALLPEAPDSPNRVLILLLGLFLSTGLAATIAIAKEAMDQSIRGREAVLVAFGAMPLANIPLMLNEEELKARRNRLILVISIVCAVTIGLLLTVHIAFKPLDVMWFVMMRRFGF